MSTWLLYSVVRPLTLGVSPFLTSCGLAMPPMVPAPPSKVTRCGLAVHTAVSVMIWPSTVVRLRMPSSSSKVTILPLMVAVQW